MEMHQIRYFLAVCDTLNFTRAAERCNVSQPSLTRAIKGLEDELGGMLFRRERNLTQLTPLGEAMRDKLASVLAQTQQVKMTARRLLNLEQAPLKLGMMCTIGHQRTVGFLSRFIRDNEGIELAVCEATPGTLVADLLEGRIEAAFIGAPTPLHDRLVTRRLYREQFVVAFPPGHRFEQMNAVPLQDIHEERYLERLNCEFTAVFDALLTESGIDVSVPYRSEREDWIQGMVLAGMGISFMPQSLPSLPGLPTRPLIDPEIAREVELATVGGREHSPALKAFVDAVETHDWTM